MAVGLDCGGGVAVGGDGALGHFAVAPLHVHGETSAGPQSVHLSILPLCRDRREQHYLSGGRLDQHFSHSGRTAEISVDLER